jgi:hypothetical protein
MVRELIEELASVLTGRTYWLDVVLPPVLFAAVNAAFSFQVAMATAVALAVVVSVIRVARKESLLYALGGLLAVLAAVAIVRVLGRDEGFFIPGILTNGTTVLLAVGSVLAKRPLVAWSSYIARRWPLAWYWHDQVRPAYSEVTWAWAVFFGMRLLGQLFLFQGANADGLVVFNLLAGWPAILALLIGSYVYGRWRLRHLAGPSVEEFRQNAPPPWQGQPRGF